MGGCATSTSIFTAATAAKFAQQSFSPAADRPTEAPRCAVMLRAVKLFYCLSGCASGITGPDFAIVISRRHVYGTPATQNLPLPIFPIYCFARNSSFIG